MDEDEKKACPNCKREIPAVNFTIHLVHCARNIRICPVCKEPFPGSELDDHHKKMHKLLPCKQCGESVCGTDLEDHIRDSCANTVKSCRFCELELPRREIPAHEVYCGVRTEQCPDCKEYVMIKYQQLHIDSNHGFIRLDDDPAPPKKEPPRLNLARPLSKSNLNRTNTSPSNVPKMDNIAIFDEFPRLPDRPTSFNAVMNSKPSNVKNRPPSSGLSNLGNPRPNKPSSSSEASNFRPSSSSAEPDSSNNGPVSSKPEIPSMNSLVHPEPGSFNDRLGLIFATPLPLPTSSNSGLGSPNSRIGSSNPRQGSSNSMQNSSNFGQDPFDTGSSYSGQDPSNVRQSSAISRQGLSNSTQYSQNPRQGLSNPPQNSSNPRQGLSNPPQNSSNPRQGLSNPPQNSSNSRQGLSNLPQNSSNPSQGSSNSTQNSSDPRQGSDRPNSSNPRPSNFDIPGRPTITNSNMRYTNEVSQGSIYNGDRPSTSKISPQETSPSVARAGGVKKRTNDQPQINMHTSATKTVEKDLGGVSLGAVKKRPAPQPPRGARRDLPYYRAMERQQHEERDRHMQNQYNLAHGLPPVLNPAQKIEKLRKLDALQNRDYEEEYRSRQRRPSPEQGFEHDHQGYRLGGHDVDEATRTEFKNLKPMSPTQFMRRFSSLQVSPPAAKADRFPEIKSSLRELRRGLNEVTAPYNANNNAAANNNNDVVRSASPQRLEEVQLPCEFCNTLVPADDLVQHQTGCRPDLAQLVPSPCRPHASDPVIPCEFCMRSLPVYLITEHQEQCIQENMPV